MSALEFDMLWNHFCSQLKAKGETCSQKWGNLCQIHYRGSVQSINSKSTLSPICLNFHLWPHLALSSLCSNTSYWGTLLPHGDENSNSILCNCWKKCSRIWGVRDLKAHNPECVTIQEFWQLTQPFHSSPHSALKYSPQANVSFSTATNCITLTQKQWQYKKSDRMRNPNTNRM